MLSDICSAYLRTHSIFTVQHHHLCSLRNAAIDWARLRLSVNQLIRVIMTVLSLRLRILPMSRRTVLLFPPIAATLVLFLLLMVGLLLTTAVQAADESPTVDGDVAEEWLYSPVLADFTLDFMTNLLSSRLCLAMVMVVS